jgi:WD40 repeat protein
MKKLSSPNAAPLPVSDNSISPSYNSHTNPSTNNIERFVVHFEYECTTSLEGHENEVKSVAWSPSLSIYSSFANLFNFPEDFRSAPNSMLPFSPHQGTLYSIPSIFSTQNFQSLSGRYLPTIENPSAQFLASCSRDKSIWVWSAPPFFKKRQLPAILSPNQSQNQKQSQNMNDMDDIQSSNDGDEDDVDDMDEIDEMDEEFECSSVLSSHTQDIKTVKFHPFKESLLFSCSYDNTLKVWSEDDDDYYCIDTLNAHSSTIWSFAFSRDDFQWSPIKIDAPSILQALFSKSLSIRFPTPSLPPFTVSTPTLCRLPSLTSTFHFPNFTQSNSDFPSNFPFIESSPLPFLYAYSMDVDDSTRLFSNILSMDSSSNSIKISHNNSDFKTDSSLSPAQSPFSPYWNRGNALVSASDDGRLGFWSFSKNPNENVWIFRGFLGGYHRRPIYTVDWGNHGLIGTGSADDSICLFAPSYSLSSGSDSESLSSHSQSASEFPSSSPSSESTDSKESKESVPFDMISRISNAHSGDVNCLSFHPIYPQIFASAGDDGTIKVWEIIYEEQ